MRQIHDSLRRLAPHTVTFFCAGALLFTAAAALFGCSGPPATQSAFAPLLAAPGADLPLSLRSQHVSSPDASHRIGKGVQRESVLYSFTNIPDGAGPYGLTKVGASLYGTTFYGGDSSCDSGRGCGTVFKITTSGTESVLYRFANSPDGAGPSAGLTNVGGTLYGTTYEGGAGFGTVFRITMSGTESVLYRFANSPDGAAPSAGLTNVSGTLYGTTSYGGAYGKGTVFKVVTSGKESVLHSFGAGSDGWYPVAGCLIKVGSALYGTTLSGAGYGWGTVFKITMSGTESVLYRFANSPDGAKPYAGLTNVGGTLYGTTYEGGAGFGTAFKITTLGTETVLHSFGTGSDGALPYAGLTNVGGTLYGTTGHGGADSSCYDHYSGCGTAFKITTSGTETALHSFGTGSDGALPYGGLTKVGGTLYGTTVEGGARGWGTVFSLSP